MTALATAKREKNEWGPFPPNASLNIHIPRYVKCYFLCVERKTAWKRGRKGAHGDGGDKNRDRNLSVGPIDPSPDRTQGRSYAQKQKGGGCWGRVQSTGVFCPKKHCLSLTEYIGADKKSTNKVVAEMVLERKFRGLGQIAGLNSFVRLDRQGRGDGASIKIPPKKYNRPVFLRWPPCLRCRNDNRSPPTALKC